MTDQSSDKNERLKKARAALKKAEAALLHAENASRSKDADYAAAREKAVRYVGLDRGKGRGKVEQKLISQGFSSELSKQVTRDLAEAGYVDEERACRSIAARHKGRKSKSRSYMLQLFLQHGISRRAAENYLPQLPEDRESIMELMPLMVYDNEKEKASVMRRLQGRGYAPSLISEVLKSIKNKD